jgi:hypothetical protein
MATWNLDTTSRPGVFAMRLEGTFNATEMREFVAQHNAGVDSFNGQPYRVFVDIRALAPLSPECTLLMEKAKQYSAVRQNFQGSAVLIASSVVAMQHRRTSKSGGVIDTELISDSEEACWQHLATVKREPGA